MHFVVVYSCSFLSHNCLAYSPCSTPEPYCLEKSRPQCLWWQLQACSFGTSAQSEEEKDFFGARFTSYNWDEYKNYTRVRDLKSRPLTSSPGGLSKNTFLQCSDSHSIISLRQLWVLRQSQFSATLGSTLVRITVD